MISSWKTSMFGVIAAVAEIIVRKPEIVGNDATAVMVANFISLGALAGLGISARSNRVSDEQAGAGRDPGKF